MDIVCYNTNSYTKRRSLYENSATTWKVISAVLAVALKEGATTITVESMNAKTTKYKVVVKSTKKVNTIKVKAKTKSVKAKSLKIKAQTVKPLAISKPKGTVTVKTTSVKLGKKKISAKKFKFTKTGKLTVTKGKYKKGTYKVTAKGNSKFKPETVIKTVNIKIK